MQQLVSINRKPADEKPLETYTDPVCKMLVRAETAAGKYEFKGDTYYFCAIGCREKFAADPERFLLNSPLYEGGVAAASADGVVLSHDGSRIFRIRSGYHDFGSAGTGARIAGEVANLVGNQGITAANAGNRNRSSPRRQRGNNRPKNKYTPDTSCGLKPMKRSRPMARSSRAKPRLNRLRKRAVNLLVNQIDSRINFGFGLAARLRRRF